jgi:hypothetical protein
MNRSTIRRSLVPLALIALCIWLTSGCIYIPTFNMTATGKDATQSVGNAGSKMKITPGATRDQVLRVLGKPFFSTSDGQYLVYSWERRKGILIWPFCFQASVEDQSYAMLLEFDPQGLLSSFDLQKGRKQAELFELPDSDRFVPVTAKLHQMELDIQRNHPEQLEEFRAATRRSIPAPLHPPPPGTPYRTEPGP